MKAIIGTSPKKARKPQQRSLALRSAIIAIAGEYDRMSVRQLFYQLVARGEIDKTEQGYKRVCSVSAQMRLDGSLAYRKITDGHRQRRVVYTASNLGQALCSAHDMYRRNYWIDQVHNVEVWCEKDALTGVIQPVCDTYGVTYVATRGFPSITLRYESAQAFIELRKLTIIYYFGDHDASGQQISANLEAELQMHGAAVIVERVGLNPWQIEQYRLPTRPGKHSDSRHAGFVATYGSDASVELDALPPNVLTEMVEERILTLIDKEVWYQTQEIESLERKTLESLAVIDWQPGIVYDLNTEESA